LTPKPKIKLERILQRVKPISAKAVNQIFGKSGQYCQHDNIDRYMRTQDHFNG